MAKRLELDLRLNAPQMRAHRALFDENGAVRRGITIFTAFGRGVGKTWYARQVWWLLVAAFDFKLRTEALEPFRGVRITCICPTLKQWKDINWGGIVDELGRGGKWEWLGARLDAQTGQIRFPGGSSIRPFPATAYSARTARGMRTDVLDADEFDDVDAEIYDGTAVPWLSEPWSLGIELLRGTPTRGRHGLWWRTLRAGKLGEKLRSGEEPENVLSADEIERYRDLAGGDDAGLDEVVAALKRIHAFHATYEDAPETVSARAIARAIATTPPATFRREWRADPDAGEGLVYPFDEAFHVQEPPPLERFREFHVGVDFGWVDAGVLLLAGIQGHGEDATVWLLDEYYESETPNHVWDQRAQEFHNRCVPYGRVTFWPDPSRPERASDFRSMGLTVAEPENDILPGIARVAELMFIRQTETGERWSRLYISPKCRNLIAELGKYRRKKLADGSFDEMPEDKWNHACVARGTLVTTSRGDVPIEFVRADDLVETRSGLRRVLAGSLTRHDAPLWRIVTARGRTLEATPEHKIFSGGEWKRIDALRYGDSVCAWANTEPLSPVNSTGSDSAGTRNRRTQTRQTTGGPDQVATFIGSSGRQRMGQFRTDTMSTIGTTIRSTMRSTTLSVCQSPTITRTTLEQPLPTRSPSCVPSLIASGISPQTGNEVKQAGIGTASTRDVSRQDYRRANLGASDAGELTQPADLGTELSSAQTHVSRLLGLHPESTTKSGPARNVGQRSLRIDTWRSNVAQDVVLVSEPAGSADVFDLTVDGAHEYFAGGILVHNCDSLRYLVVGRFGKAQNFRSVVSGR